MSDAIAELAARLSLNGQPAQVDHAHRRLDVAHLLATGGDEPPWRCDRFVADGFVTVLAAEGGDGKTMLAYALAGAVQTGETVAGIGCQKGRVAVFDAEMGPRALADRVRLLGVPVHGLAAYDADGLDLRRDADWIAGELDGINLAVFDSLRQLAPGAKENDSDDMAPVMSALRKLSRDTGAGVLLIHHAGKSEDSHYRGSSAIRDQTDLMFTLTRGKGDPEKQWRRRLRTSKCRIDREPDDRWFGIKAHRGHIFLSEAEPYGGTGRATPVRDEVAVAALQALRKQEPLRRPTIADRVGRPKDDKTVERALEHLEATRQIFLTGDGYMVATKPNDQGDHHDHPAPRVGGGHCAPPLGGADDHHPQPPVAPGDHDRTGQT